MLTGDVPFHGDTEFAVYQHQVTTRPPDPRSVNKAVSARVARIVSRALAKNPADRIQGCEQFRRMLAREADLPRARVRRKHIVLIAASTLALLLSFLLAPIHLAPRHNEPEIPMAQLHTAAAPTDTAKGHDLALAALQSLSLVCRESAVKQRKEEGKRLAEQVPDSAIAESFQQQIAEAEQNVADFAAQYRDRVRELAAIDAGTAKQSLDGLAGDSSRAAYITAIERDVEATRAGDAERATGAVDVCER
jgi:hypothetical protein